MNTRSKIINLLKKSNKSLSPKEISLELKKTSANIRKILSNLYLERKIEKASFGKYKSSVNVKPITVNVKEEKVHILNNTVNLEELIKKAKREYQKDYRSRNPEYNKKWLSAYYKKYPEKLKEYKRRYWEKKALEILKRKVES